MNVDEDNHEGIKKRITKLLNYYGFDVTPEWRLPNNRRIDLVAEYANQVLVGVEVELTSNLKDDIDRLSQIDLDYRFVITNRPIQDIGYGNKKIEMFSTKDLLVFEDRVRNIVSAGNRPRYKEVEINIEDRGDCQEVIAKFDRIVEQASFNPLRMHGIIYSGEVVSQGSGRNVFNQDSGFSKEYAFLSSLGVWDYDYRTGTDRSRWTRLRECVVKQRLLARDPEIRDIIDRHPKHFNYVMLVGTLGNVFYNGNSFQALQDYKNFSDVLPVNIRTQYWLRRVCETESKVTLEYYREWLEAGIGIRDGAYDYIPLKEMLKQGILDISSWGFFDQEALRDFSFWYILSEMSRDPLYRERDNSDRYVRNSKDLIPFLEETAKAELTSELLPEPSKELFAVYNSEKMRQYSQNKLHQLAKKILE